eukprot:scaffold313438_cov33-Tisochrysis_lutea.AAC.4
MRHFFPGLLKKRNAVPLTPLPARGAHQVAHSLSRHAQLALEQCRHVLPPQLGAAKRENVHVVKGGEQSAPCRVPPPRRCPRARGCRRASHRAANAKSSEKTRRERPDGNSEIPLSKYSISEKLLRKGESLVFGWVEMLRCLVLSIPEIF